MFQHIFNSQIIHFWTNFKLRLKLLTFTHNLLSFVFLTMMARQHIFRLNAVIIMIIIIIRLNFLPE